MATHYSVKTDSDPPVVVTLVETTTPTPVEGSAKIYSKGDNLLYLQDGAGAEHVLESAGSNVKHEFHLPAEPATDNVGNWSVEAIGTSQSVHFVFQVSEAFEALVNAKIVMIPDATETIQWDVLVSVAAVGEAYTNDDRSAADQTLGVTASVLTEIDISGVLTGLAPGDYVAIDFQSDTAVLRILGFEFDYT